MKRKNSFDKILALVAGLVGLSFSGVLFAQDGTSEEPVKESTKSTDDSEKVYGTYLDVIHAKDGSEKYNKLIMDDIYKLQIVVENYGTAEDKSNLKSILDNHKNGVKLQYKRDYLGAFETFKQVRKDIKNLFDNLVKNYEAKAHEILNKCADRIVDLELGIDQSGSADPNEQGRSSKKVEQGKLKLILAYNQLDMATGFLQADRLSDAIVHFRLAKLYGISILVDLTDPADQEKVKSEYKTDLMDADNRVATK